MIFFLMLKTPPKLINSFGGASFGGALNINLLQNHISVDPVDRSGMLQHLSGKRFR